MSTVDRIISICKSRKIPISTLEKACGFSNGYLGSLKKGSLPDNRLAKVAEYLGMDIYELQGWSPEASSVIRKVKDNLIEDDRVTAERMRSSIWEKYEKDITFMEYIRTLFYLPRSYQNSVYDFIDYQNMKVMQGKNTTLDA